VGADGVGEPLEVRQTGRLYRLFGERIRNGYGTVKSQHIFRDFINAVANVMITERDIAVRFRKTRPQPIADGRPASRGPICGGEYGGSLRLQIGFDSSPDNFGFHGTSVATWTTVASSAVKQLTGHRHARSPP
jgi:hypothetical protein